MNFFFKNLSFFRPKNIFNINIFFYLTILFLFNLPINKTLSENRNELNIEYLDKKKSIDYILGPGDVLSIKLSNSLPKLSKNLIIEPSGQINLPKINRVYVKGLTLNELTNLLNKKYADILISPNIKLDIVRYRPAKVYITGEIESPGLYYLNYNNKNLSQLNNLSNNLITNEKISNTNIQVFQSPTIFDLIRKAGGVTLKSDLENIDIIRINTISNGGGKIKATIDLKRLIEFGEFSNNIELLDGDYITINKLSKNNYETLSSAIKSNLNPKYIEVFVSGRVQEPGAKRVSKQTTLNDAILISGGKRVITGKINFIRINNDGSYEKRKFRYKENALKGSYNNPILKNGDFIIVGRGKIATFNEFIGEITSPFVGIYSTKELYEDLTE